MAEENLKHSRKKIAKKQRIGDILINAGLVNQDQMKEALQNQVISGKRIGTILVEMGFLSEENMVGALSKQLGFPSIDLKKISITDELLNILPKNFLVKNQVVPVEKDGDKVKIAMVNPLDRSTINDIEFMVGSAVYPLVVSSSAMQHFLKSRVAEDENMKIRDTVSADKIEVVEKEIVKIDLIRLKKAYESSPIIRIVNKFLGDAIKSGTTSIHIKPRQNDILVRYRIDGLLRNMTTLPAQAYPAILARLKSMARMDISVSLRSQNGGVRLKIDERFFDLRLSTLPTLHGEKVVIRIMEKNQKMRSLENLGMHPKDLSNYYSLISRPRNIILIAGPTGCGASTTLYTTLRYLRSEETNIVTIEDPVEYEIPGINQVQVNPDENISFGSGLRSILNQDPDIIMVSEIRDPETAHLIFKSSLRGHMILSAIYTNNAVSALTHLMNFGIQYNMAATAIEGVVAQRLVRRNCPHCLEKYIPEPRVMVGLNIDVMEVSKMRFYHGRGCRQCSGTGYSGQIGIFEILNIDHTIKDLILKQASAREIYIAARNKGMTTMEENGLYLALNKITTLEEILRVVPHEDIETRRKGAWEKQIISMFDDAIYIL
ncbi:Putative type II secretion system protein [Desulfonema limicola]|uniref:Type II secretion system protein n=1 Tax=Desulfonema limicola TaxID=45656 RepID=A0A975B812_9BACT|nr:GspE/PulE family protein [Desulfonema limicola]QTA80327.1 Putative type II secretion system protein [Desulfonema limicola]